MAENSQYPCCRRAVAAARLQDRTLTVEEIAWALSISPRWVRELRGRGVLPEGAKLPELVKRMARYRPEAKAAGHRAARRARTAKHG